jgi:hypothetical protein
MSNNIEGEVVVITGAGLMPHSFLLDPQVDHRL